MKPSSVNDSEKSTREFEIAGDRMGKDLAGSIDTSTRETIKDLLDRLQHDLLRLKEHADDPENCSGEWSDLRGLFDKVQLDFVEVAEEFELLDSTIKDLRLELEGESFEIVFGVKTEAEEREGEAPSEPSKVLPRVSGLELVDVPETETESETETAAGPELEIESETDTETETETETDTETETEADTDTDTDTDTETATHTEPKPETPSESIAAEDELLALEVIEEESVEHETADRAEHSEDNIGEVKLEQKLDHLIRIVKTHLEEKAPRGEALPVEWTQRIAREVARRLKTSLVTPATPVSTSEDKTRPAETRKKIELDDVAAMIDEITGNSP